MKDTNFRSNIKPLPRGIYFVGKKNNNNKTNKIDYFFGLREEICLFLLIGLSPQVTKETVIKGKVVPLIFQEARC